MYRLRSLKFAVTLLPILLFAHLAHAADRERLEAFLEVTGFDVALESIKLSASSAPNMIGLEAEAFGSEWTRLTQDVFVVEVMHNLALDILGETLSDELLDHAADFYASDLGKRLVVAENDSHLEEDEDLKREMGDAIVSGLQSIDGPRVAYLKRLITASDSAETGIRAIREIQVRFLIAAAGAGVIELQLEEPDLREALSEGEDEMRANLAVSALSGAAFTYQSFSDEEVLEYAKALEHDKMKQVYDLMNAVQYEIMANRFEALAVAMGSLQPSQEL
ncbi:MAG: DUF2059 domain-containing protein [Paracoccaceae bacterium]